jgi:hypothetical protein
MNVRGPINYADEIALAIDWDFIMKITELNEELFTEEEYADILNGNSVVPPDVVS